MVLTVYLKKRIPARLFFSFIMQILHKSLQHFYFFSSSAAL